MAKYVGLKRDGRVGASRSTSLLLRCSGKADRPATLTLCNPPYNLVTREMTEELDVGLAKLELDNSVGAIVIVRRYGATKLTAKTSNTPGIFLSHYDVEEVCRARDHYR